jgi:hypothetical protein
MTSKKQKVIEIYDKHNGKWIKAVIPPDSDPDKSTYMYDFIMAQVEVFTVMDEMELDIATVDKN